MPKKKKLSLNSFKVTSFVTSLDNKTANQAKGGVTVYGPLCSVEVCDTVVCSATHCPDPCPNGMAPTVWPCQSVHKNCHTGIDCTAQSDCVECTAKYTDCIYCG